ncbi:MAG: hypothetical protein WCL18_03920 [bacterium]
MKKQNPIILTSYQRKMVASYWSLEALNLFEKYVQRISDPMFNTSDVLKFFDDAYLDIRTLYKSNLDISSSHMRTFLCKTFLSKHPQKARIRPLLVVFYFLLGERLSTLRQIKRITDEVKDFEEMSHLSAKEYLKRRETKTIAAFTTGLYRNY